MSLVEKCIFQLSASFGFVAIVYLVIVFVAMVMFPWQYVGLVLKLAVRILMIEIAKIAQSNCLSVDY